MLALVGNSGVYAENGAVEASGIVQNEEKLVASDNKTNPEALTIVENSDVRADENGIVEGGEKLVDSNNGLILKIKKILTRMINQKVFSFDSSTVKIFGAGALVTGAGLSAYRVINSFGSSSKPEQGGAYTRKYEKIQNDLFAALSKIANLEKSRSDIRSENDKLKKELIEKKKLLGELQNRCKFYKDLSQSFRKSPALFNAVMLCI